ncbi:MAG TPA: 50S ribosomal protein L9 [Ignavibacteria bacterium]|nr:50S ribosomal protein L9 [Ignavibacteria bacterium]
MKVILRQNFESLGQVGDVIQVNNGYARNFLIPRKIAYAALEGNVRTLEAEKKILVKKRELDMRNAESLAAELEKISVTIPVQVGEEDKIFGSVTSQMIVDALEAKNYHLDKRKIEIDEPIKSLGIYGVSIKVHPNITAKVKVWVVRE